MRGQIGDLLPLILLIFLVAGGGYAITQVLGQLNSLSQTLSTMKNEIIISLILLALISYIWKTKQANNVTLFIAFMCVLYMVYKIMYTPAIIFGSDGYIISPSPSVKPVTQTILSLSNHGKTIDLNQLPGERDCLIEVSPKNPALPYKYNPKTETARALCFYWRSSGLFSSVLTSSSSPSFPLIGTSPNLPVWSGYKIYIVEYEAKYKTVSGVFEPVVTNKIISEEVFSCTGSPISGLKPANCTELYIKGYPEYALQSVYFEGIRGKEFEYRVSIIAPFYLREPMYEMGGFNVKYNKTEAQIYLKKYYVGTRDDEYVYHITFGVLCTPNVRFFVKFYNSMFAVTEMEGGLDYCDGKLHYVNVTVPTNEGYTGFQIVMETGLFVIKKVSKTFILPKLPVQKRKPIKVNNSQQKQKLIKICKNNSLKAPVKVANHIYTVSKEFRITKDYHFVTYVDTNDFTNLSYILLCNKVSTPYLVLNTNKNNAVNCTSKVCSFIIDVQLPNISRNNTCELYVFKNGKTVIKEKYTFTLNISKEQQESYKPDYSNQNINYPTSTYKKVFQTKMYLYYIMLLIAVVLIIYMVRRR